MLKLVRKLRQNEAGATAIEYGLIAALVAIAAITALSNLGGSLSDKFQQVSSSLDNASE